MADPSLNPYASPDSLPAAVRHPRPIGTFILAALFLMFGLVVGGGGAIRFLEMWSMAPSPVTAAICSRFALFGILAIAAVSASVGLLSGYRFGWWVAVAFCYLGFAAFVLFPVVCRRVSDRIPVTVVMVALCLAYWFYLQRMNVRAYFDQAGRYRWRVHIGLFVLSVIVVFGLGIW